MKMNMEKPLVSEGNQGSPEEIKKAEDQMTNQEKSYSERRDAAIEGLRKTFPNLPEEEVREIFLSTQYDEAEQSYSFSHKGHAVKITTKGSYEFSVDGRRIGDPTGRELVRLYVPVVTSIMDIKEREPRAERDVRAERERWEAKKSESATPEEVAESLLQ